VDIVTQKGIAGIEVNVVDFWTDGWNYEIPITGTAITDSEGDFVVNYTVKEKNDARLMQLCYLPDGYQRGARINGKIETCVFFDLLFDYGDLSGDYKVEDEGSYQVELMPANTFAYLVRPAVPAAWLADTIEINTSSWYNPLYDHSNNLGCHDIYATVKFPISDETSWGLLGNPSPLIIGDKVGVEYRVYNGNITRKIHHTDFQCHFNDTTAMVLTF
jgi:hypothetical protein